MIEVKILNVDRNPLSLISSVARICYNEKAEIEIKMGANLAKECLASGHGRVGEFADVTIAIKGLSVRVGRELMRHTVGVSFLQASTRYINYKEFNYVTPPSLKDNERYLEVMNTISNSYGELLKLGVPKEDLGMMLPLAIEGTIVMKINVRALIHLFNVRSCSRAYHEFRELMRVIRKELMGVDEEWQFLAINHFVPKCVLNGYCDEQHGACGRYPKK